MRATATAIIVPPPLHCHAVAACWHSTTHPNETVWLSKAAFVAGMYYMLFASILCRECASFEWLAVWCTLPVAWVGAHIADEVFDSIAWLMLPPDFYQHFTQHGLLTRKFSHKAAAGCSDCWQQLHHATMARP